MIKTCDNAVQTILYVLPAACCLRCDFLVCCVSFHLFNIWASVFCFVHSCLLYDACPMLLDASSTLLIASCCLHGF